MRISDWSSDVCSSDLPRDDALDFGGVDILAAADDHVLDPVADEEIALGVEIAGVARQEEAIRSEEHTSELQSLMRISYAVFCLKKKKQLSNDHNNNPNTSQPTLAQQSTTTTNTPQ